MGAWGDFCRELEHAGAILDRPESPDGEIDRAEGLRYLTRLLRVGLDLTLEFADPLHPALISAQESHFGDGGNTADCVYLHAVIDVQAPPSVQYTVQSGDTLSKIAKAHLGDANAYMKIFEANKDKLSDPDKIQVGQVLTIPTA